ncbi:hypothetical protein L0F63_002982, partial [Massospora cicadina]
AAIYRHNNLHSAGVLLQEKIVLTTADQHTEAKENYEVLLQHPNPPKQLDHVSRSKLTLNTIKDKVIHPDFQPFDAPINNLCILKLNLGEHTPTLLYGDPATFNIKLDESFLHLIGWGTPIELNAIPTKQCRKAIGLRLVNKTEYCFSSSLNHVKATNFPRGSPLFVHIRNTVILAGIYSWPLKMQHPQVPLLLSK